MIFARADGTRNWMERPDALLSLLFPPGYVRIGAFGSLSISFTIEVTNVLILHKHMHISRIVVAGALLGLAGCGSGSRLMNSGNGELAPLVAPIRSNLIWVAGVGN